MLRLAKTQVRCVMADRTHHARGTTAGYRPGKIGKDYGTPAKNGKTRH